jgi:hypothetical protein
VNSDQATSSDAPADLGRRDAGLKQLRARDDTMPRTRDLGEALIDSPG